ncbi:hypothetical protein VOLCADRAFT_89448 [Volvox carteri f. nagariensis]|uniref:Uncharacterized protein n=1 Tax=Volvox carteri f. nagariensis TaxID=3068 RepID=D8TRQ4_VOLCA|nr:uncharacterized protein VOLCADRAFT_89448 [Volvox carteri f. nagariensis]EFJ49939.1 hypothetical protein VOLCADRAFT_89448 [Volvox carteri f. nagariensis]|eukprot:XP_002949004.1 hypothetical protein VOLCADRAFT_89448 [Volvox carteri f. nagariensis]
MDASHPDLLGHYTTAAPAAAAPPQLLLPVIGNSPTARSRPTHRPTGTATPSAAPGKGLLLQPALSYSTSSLRKIRLAASWQMRASGGLTSHSRTPLQPYVTYIHMD